MQVLPLNKQNSSSISSRLKCPDYDRNLVNAGIVHIGVGGFHRSHQAYYMHQLLADPLHYNWGICGIGLREGDKNIAKVLKEQDGLYTLITQHANATETCEVIGAIVDYIFAFKTPQLAIDKMANENTKIVSLTITEGGYNFNPNTGDFNFDNADVQHDLLHPNKPKTVFGFLTAALNKRRDNGLPAFTILSCDNIQHNGDVTRNMLMSFVKRQNPELSKWIEREVSFPNAMVDRITPVTPKSAIEFLKNKYQVVDNWPIVCEPYIQWVIEDDFCNEKPPLEKLGVQFVPDVTPYEQMKIRLLNAGHSVLALPGSIYGHATINECIEDTTISSFMRHYMDTEVTHLLGEIKGIDLTAYKNSLEERFANPNIKDGLSRICSESSAKLPKFLIPTIQENLELGKSIKYGTFILAVWCYYSDKRMNVNNQQIEIIDERKEELHLNAKLYEEDKFSFLRISDIFGNLGSNKRFCTHYSKMIDAIYKEPNMHTLMTLISKDNYISE